MSSIDVDILSRLLRHPTEITELLYHGITEKHLRGKIFSDAFNFIMDHRSKHKKIPDISTVETHVGFKASDPPEPMGFYCKQVIERMVYYTMQDGMNESVDLMNDGKIMEAVGHLRMTSQKGEKEASYSQKVYSTEIQVPDRRKRYLDAKTRTGPEGWPLPWEPFTEATRGWLPGDFGLLGARTGVGKTFILLLMAHWAWAAGAKTLFISMEMEPEEIQLRHDAYMAGVPLDKLSKGELTAKDEATYMDALREMEKLDGIKIVGHNMSATVTHLTAAIERFEPDIVFIDSIYLMKPSFMSFKSSRHDKVSDMGDEVAVLATDYHIPIIGSIQANREQRKSKREFGVEHIYGTDVLGQHSPLIFGLVATLEDLRESSISCNLVKNRRGPQVASRLEWDFDDMEFNMLEHEVGVPVLPKKAAPKPTWR